MGLFNKNTMLHQQVETEDPAVGVEPQPAPQSSGLMQNVVELAEKAAANPILFGQGSDLEEQGDAASKPVDLENAGRIVQTAADSDDPPVTYTGTGLDEPPKAGKKPVGPFRTVGTDAPHGEKLTPGQQEFLDEVDMKERAALRAQGEAALQAGLSTEQAFTQLRDLELKDYGVYKKLITEEFPKYRAAVQELDNDIDAVRTQRINPDNYMQQLGRGSATASALNIGIAQLAAGAGNANGVLKRVQAATERDIAAQKDNIELAFKGIDAKKQSIDDQIALMNSQLTFMDRARAVAYAGITAELARAKQHATNESEYINIQMIEDRMEALSVHHKAKAQAMMGTTYLDITTAQAWQATNYKDQLKAAKDVEALKLTAMDREGIEAPADLINAQGERIYSAEQGAAPGPAIGPATPAAPLPATPAESRGKRRSPSAAASAPGPARTADTPTPSPGVSENQSSADGGLSSDMAASPLSNEALDALPAIAPPEQPRSPRLERFIREMRADEEATTGRAYGGPTLDGATGERRITQEDVDRITPMFTNQGALSQGSYAREKARKLGEPRWDAIPTTYDLVDMLRQRPEVPQLAETFNDAKILAELDEPPRRTANMSKEAHRKMLKRYQHRQRNPELYEKFRNWPDETNYLDSDFGPIHLKARSALRRVGTGTDERKWTEERRTVEQGLNDTYLAFESNFEQAEKIYKRGFGGFMGFTLNDKGFSFTPADPEARSDLALMQSNLMRLSIAAIKTADPSGRLTDKDIEVGQQMANIIQDKKNMGWDLLQTAVNKALGTSYSVSAMRQAAGRYFGGVSVVLMKNAAKKISSDVVFNYESTEHFQKNRDEKFQWLGNDAPKK